MSGVTKWDKMSKVKVNGAGRKIRGKSLARELNKRVGLKNEVREKD